MRFWLNTLNKEQKRTLLLATLWLAAFFISLIAIKGSFLADEYEFIYAAARIHSFPDFWQVMNSKIGGDFFRPILYLSFITDYWIYGLASWGYHLTNSILYATTSCLITASVWDLGKLYCEKKKKTTAINNSQSLNNLPFIATLSGILFALLPNHHETVTWLAGRTDLLATLFYVAALYVYLRYLRVAISGIPNENKTKQKTQTILFMFLFCLFAALAYGAKEISITLIIVQIVIGGWYIFSNRGEKTKKNSIKLGLLFILNSAIVVSYIVLRHHVIGYWVGGYITGGQSIFLNITPVAIKRWLLAPVLFAVYSVNYAYAFAVAQRFARLPLIFRDYTWFVASIQYSIYVGISFIVITFVWLTKRKRLISLSSAVIFAGALFFYLTTIPVIAVLPTLNRDLESTRFLYLPSIAIAIVLAYWLSLWNGRQRIIVTTIFLTMLMGLFVFNFHPWALASRSAGSIQQAVTNTASTIHENDWIYVVNVPDNIYGAYVFRRGLPHMFYLILHGAINTERVIMTGRGIAGTHAPECINTQSDQYYVMQLDEVSGIVQSFKRFERTSPPPDTIVNLENSTYELNDIIQQENGSYRVTGSNPYITFTNLEIDPKKITDIIFSATPEHPYIREQWDLYWTTNAEPSYNFFQRHFWFFQGSTTDKTGAPRITIPVCQYPAFVFSDTIKTIRIRFPYRDNEVFILSKP